MLHARACCGAALCHDYVCPNIRSPNRLAKQDTRSLHAIATRDRQRGMNAKHKIATRDNYITVDRQAGL